MAEITEGSPAKVDIDPEVQKQLDALKRQLIEHDAMIAHWRGVAMDAAEVAVKVQKTMQENPARRRAAVQNVFAVAGLASVGVGCWLVSPATSLICIGSVLLAAVILGTAARYRLEVERVRHSR